MASQLDDEQREEFTEAFQAFDKNKDGRVNGKELQALMRYMGTILSDAETMEMIRECGGTDSIDSQQFLSYASRKMADNSTIDDLVLAFQAFDKDGNGFISLSELRFVLTCLGDKLDEDAVEAMLDQADPSGVGSVQYESFIRNMIARGE